MRTRRSWQLACLLLPGLASSPARGIAHGCRAIGAADDAITVMLHSGRALAIRHRVP